MADLCDTCWYNNYDENDDMYYCDLQLDQDEYGKMIERERQVSRASIIAETSANTVSSESRIEY